MGGHLRVLSSTWLMIGFCSLSARVLHGALLVSVLLYGSETVVWRKKEKYRIRAVQMVILRGLLGVRRIERCRMRGLESRVK